MLGFWLEGNLDTYPFIDAPSFEDNLTCVKSPFPEAHMIAAKDAGIILGFIDLIKSSIEGLFVGLAYRKKGRGKALIDAVKNEGSSLAVAAFSKKMGVIRVYQREEFVLLRRKKDCGTGKESLIFFFMRKKDVGDA